MKDPKDSRTEEIFPIPARPGRPPLGEKAMTSAERQRAYRQRRAIQAPASPPKARADLAAEVARLREENARLRADNAELVRIASSLRVFAPLLEFVAEAEADGNAHPGLAGA